MGSMDAFHEFVRQGDIARDCKDWATAVKYYRAALAENASALSISVQLGHALKESGEFNEAEQAYRQFWEENPSDADVQLQLGHLFNRQGLSKLAVPWYARTMKAAAYDSTIADDARRGLNHSLTDVLNAKGDAARESSDDPLGELIDLEWSEELGGVVGDVYREFGWYRLARVYYDRFGSYVMKTAPSTRFEVEIRLGDLEKQQRNYAKAIAYYSRALEALVRDWEATELARQGLLGRVQSCLAQMTSTLVVK